VCVCAPAGKLSCDRCERSDCELTRDERLELEPDRGVALADDASAVPHAHKARERERERGERERREREERETHTQTVSDGSRASDGTDAPW
jgi:hypothetical protein